MPEYDAAFKRVCQRVELVRSYLLYAQLSEELLIQLDLSTLRPAPTTLVSETLQQRHADMIWLIDYHEGQGTLYVVLHVEFQSQNDFSMALRMLTYAALIYESIWQHQIGRDKVGKLPTVLPMVLYSGIPPWTAPLEVGDLLGDGAVEWQPTFRYLLVDERRLVEAQVVHLEEPAGALMLLRHASEYDIIWQAQRQIEGSTLYRSNRRAYDELAQAVGAQHFGKEVSTMVELGSRFAELERNAEIRWTAVGVERGKQEGKQEGRQEEKERVAMNLLNKGMSARDIRDCTGLTLEQIRNLQNGA